MYVCVCLKLEVFAAPAFLGVVMSLFVCSSLPPTAPSSSAAEEQEPFFQGIKKVKEDCQFSYCLFLTLILPFHLDSI